MSPEVLAHAAEEYLKMIQHQIETAKAFYFGRLAEGMEGLMALPEAVRLQIDQLIWESVGGEAIDPTEERSRELVASAIMHSVETRMGIL